MRTYDVYGQAVREVYSMTDKKYFFTEKELAEAVRKAWKEGRLTFALDAGAHQRR